MRVGGLLARMALRFLDLGFDFGVRGYPCVPRLGKSLLPGFD
jgi:hypothetical protein